MVQQVHLRCSAAMRGEALNPGTAEEAYHAGRIEV